MSGHPARKCRCGGAVETRCVECGHPAPSGASALAAVLADLRDRIAALEASNQKLADRLGAQESTGPGQLVDATAVARMLGTRRDWVYAHAAELGAIRAGNGTRPRLRFDPALVKVRLDQRNGEVQTPKTQAHVPGSCLRRISCL